jgi:putative ABC transport system substrate-binding protein
MRERGWVEGKNLALQLRYGNRDQASALAAELVESNVHVIVAQGAMAYGAKAAGGATPVVFAFSGDPVEAKLVASLARPGGNVTGVTLLSYELASKRLELLKEAFPGLERVAILANVAHPGEQAELRESQAAAQRLGLSLQYLPVQTADDFRVAFEALEREGSEAIVAFPDLLIMSQASSIALFAARRRIPSVSGWPEFAERGNLMTYGPGLGVWRQVADQVDKILKGAKPADLPVEQPTKFELVINLKTAKALDLTVPQSLLLRADKVIQ